MAISIGFRTFVTLSNRVWSLSVISNFFNYIQFCYISVQMYQTASLFLNSLSRIQNVEFRLIGQL